MFQTIKSLFFFLHVVPFLKPHVVLFDAKTMIIRHGTSLATFTGGSERLLSVSTTFSVKVTNILVSRTTWNLVEADVNLHIMHDYVNYAVLAERLIMFTIKYRPQTIERFVNLFTTGRKMKMD